MNKVVIGVLIVLGTALSIVRHVFTDPPNANSIAVLSFNDQSAVPDQKYFTDGLTEEIANRLRQAGLSVKQRETSGFKARNVRASDIARSLHVDAVLQGTVRRDGDNVRTTVTLFDATKHSLVWSETFDRTSTGVFALQDELSSSIAEPVKALLVK